MAAKKNPTTAKREQGISISATALKMKDGDTAEGTVTTIEHITGGRYDNERTRVTLVTDDGEVNVLYMPDRWATILSKWGGAYVWIKRNGTGLATRWDVKIEKGATPSASALLIESVVMEDRAAKKPRGATKADKGRAAKNAGKLFRK